MRVYQGCRFSYANGVRSKTSFRCKNSVLQQVSTHFKETVYVIMPYWYQLMYQSFQYLPLLFRLIVFFFVVLQKSLSVARRFRLLFPYTTLLMSGFKQLLQLIVVLYTSRFKVQNCLWNIIEPLATDWYPYACWHWLA